MATTVTDAFKAQGAGIAVSPVRLAHFVLRTSRFRQLIDWYKLVLNGQTAFDNGSIAFISYDEEHHRVAFIAIPDLGEQPDGICGLHHVAFTYANLGDLLGTYARLRDHGIEPLWSINHGPTTSMYYGDPDANQIELQVDNFVTVEEAGEFFYSEAFAVNPIGVDFDPADLHRRYSAGESEASLLARPGSGPRGVDGINIR